MPIASSKVISIATLTALVVVILLIFTAEINSTNYVLEPFEPLTPHAALAAPSPPSPPSPSPPPPPPINSQLFSSTTSNHDNTHSMQPTHQPIDEPPLPPPAHIAILNPTTAWLRPPSTTHNGIALLLFRRFDGSNTSTWYKGHPTWRHGSIRNFVGESCLVGALATTVGGADAPLRLQVDPSSIHFAHDCAHERSLPFERKSRIEDARLFKRADGKLQIIYSSPVGGGLHTIFTAPIELTNAADGTKLPLLDGNSPVGENVQIRAHVALDQKVELCSGLLTSLKLHKSDQKNWSPFAYASHDYVVFSLIPLRVFKVDHSSGECTEASARTPQALSSRLAECNRGATSEGAPTFADVPLKEQNQAWRRCTGSLLPLPRGIGDATERRLRRGFTLSFGGGTPGVLLEGMGGGDQSAGQQWAPAWLARSGLSTTADRGRGVLLFAGHSKLKANSAAMLDRIVGVGPGVFADVGPEHEWHQSYEKLYHVFWYAIRPPPLPTGAASDAPFELVSISRLFTPPNTRTSHPKIVYPSGLLLAPTQGAPCSSLPLSSPLCVKTTKLLLTYGELDVFAHAWAPSLVEVGRSMLPPDALAPDASDLPLVLRAAEATRRRSASAAQVNELAAPLYAAALAAGGAANGSATQHVVGQRSCRQRGYEVHWNAALHAFDGAPRHHSDDDARCSRLVSEEAASPQECCAICAAAAPRGHDADSGCTSWTYFAPKCYWAAGCTRTLADKQVMWGAVAGLTWGAGRSDA